MYISYTGIMSLSFSEILIPVTHQLSRHEHIINCFHVIVNFFKDVYRITIPNQKT